MTRSPAQCRSHHQKMLKHYKNIKGIIKYVGKLEKFHMKKKVFKEDKKSHLIECFPR